jgi:hypothetical protein
LKFCEQLKDKVKMSKRGKDDSDASGSTSKGSEDSFERDFRSTKNQNKKVKKNASDVKETSTDMPLPEKINKERRLSPFEKQIQKAMELSMVKDITLKVAATEEEVKDVTEEPNKVVKKVVKKIESTSSESSEIMLVMAKNIDKLDAESSEKNNSLPTEATNENKEIDTQKKPSLAEPKTDEVIDIDHDDDDDDDFKKQDIPQKTKTPAKPKKSTSVKSAEKIVKKSSKNKTEKIEENSERIAEVKKPIKKKALKLTDTEDEQSDSHDDSDDDFDDDDDDFVKKKNTAKKVDSQKTKPAVDKKKPIKKKSTETKENIPEAKTKIEQSKPVVKEIAKAILNTTTPVNSKTVSFTNATSTPSDASVTSGKNHLEAANPVNRFLANNNIVNKSASSSSSPLGRIEIKTPSPFARVGLSRNSKVKPLHPNAKLN